MTDEQIKYMVDRFLGWRLPENFRPDAGISFERQWHMNFAGLDRIPSHPLPMPTGTSLLDAAQAEAMVRYMIENCPVAQEGPDREQIAALLFVTRYPMSIWSRASLAETEMAYRQADAILALNTTGGK